MASIPQVVQRSLAGRISLACRRLLLCAIVALLAVLLLQSFVIEAFHIPTGSMAPTLLGHHRVCVCPRCGHEFAVGRSSSAPEDQKAFCPNCGLHPLSVADAPERDGDQILVDKTAYLRRAPSRWEIVVFRLLNVLYIKRLLGLPGEEIRIHDGDLYVNGRLCRKTLEEARRMRILVEKGSGVVLINNIKTTPDPFSVSRKCEPLRDEYAYNGGVHADSECVHDFLIEAELETTPGHGTVALRLCDGSDWVEVLLSFGNARPAEAFTWPIDDAQRLRKIAQTEKSLLLRSRQRHRVEMAFVDRRLSVAANGQLLLQVDLPEVRTRQGVSRPFQIQADGVEARLHRFRLYRDIHYGQQGRNAVQGKAVHLGADQYFMLGDNSPNSEDSRFWLDEGRVRAADLIGPILRTQRYH